MTWQEISVLVAMVAAASTLIGWLLPSPIQITNRLAAVERDLAVLVSTVSTLRQTVDDLVKYTRQGFGNGNDGGSGRRTRI